MGLSVRQDPYLGANGPTKCGTYLLASSLAAALPAERRVLARRGWAGENRSLFEHPAWLYPIPLEKEASKFHLAKIVLPQTLSAAPL